MKKKLSIFLLASTMFGIELVNAQGYRHDSLVVEIHATVVGAESGYRYIYDIANHSSSQQRMAKIYVEAGDIGTEWDGTIDTIYTRTNKNWATSTKRILAPPLNQSNRGVIGWFEADTISSLDELYSPNPNLVWQGESIHVGFRSRGLPGIKRFWAEGWTPPLTTSGYDSLRALGYPDSVILKPWYQDAFIGKTISPVIQPIPFNGFNFLDTLLSYTRQSAALGWLGRNRDDDCDDDERPDDGVVRNIENRLQKARRELVRGDSVKARRELLKLVRKLDRLQRRDERVMTSEAYALLKYNAEYLIERLPERRRR